MEELQANAAKLVAKGKGILAADESSGTADKRLAAIGLEGSEENRRRYRDLFIGTPGIGAFMSVIILYDETMDQRTNDGRPFLRVLKEEGIMIGIKVDQGKEPDPNSFGETITKGLASLPERLPKYYEMGARFAKWRAVIQVDETLPTLENLQHEINHLAQYARMCQDHGLVPMVEPEVLLKGDHNIRRAADVTQETLTALFMELKRAEVDFSGTILKTSMVVNGADHPDGKASPSEVAQATIDVLRATVPDDLAGVVFLSGGQDPNEATANLKEIKGFDLPWPVTFSFARAIQGPALQQWGGDDANLEHARSTFLEHLQRNALAAQGK